jgi:hypothetical protein
LEGKVDHQPIRSHRNGPYFLVVGLVLIVVVYAIWGFGGLFIDRLNQSTDKQTTEQISPEPSVVIPVVQPTVPTAQPTYTPISQVQQRYTVETTFSGYILGPGSFRLRFTIFPKSDGLYARADDAQAYISDTAAEVRKICLWDNQDSVSNHFYTISNYGNSNDHKVDQKCWDMLYSLTGQHPRVSLPQDVVDSLHAVSILEGFVAGERTIIDSKGRFLGNWPNYSPNDTGCLEQSMKKIGWDGTPYFFVGWGDQNVSGILEREGFPSSVYLFQPVIPNFCKITN